VEIDVDELERLEYPQRMGSTRLVEKDLFGLRGDAIMKVKILAPCIVTIALLLTVGILALITSLTLEHLKNRKTVIVSYPCIVVKGDKWIRSAEVEMRNYVISCYDWDDHGVQNLIAKR
jgi:hypothetical protein